VTHGHALVWLDHREAVIIEFSADDHHVKNIRGEAAAGKLHQKSGKPGSGHAPDDVELFAAVIRTVAAPEILVVGPGTAKSAFEHFARAQHPAFAQRLAGVETVDHPTYGQLLAHGREFFRRFDQLHSERHISASIVK